MHCPSCAVPTSVLAVEVDEHEATLRRRRMCRGCGLRFVTLEHYELVPDAQPGVHAPYSRWRVITGVRAAAQRQRQVIDAAAHRRHARGGALDPPHTRHIGQHQPTEPSKRGATSPYSLVPASGRGCASVMPSNRRLCT
ncbi:NrdR family transcriptional regulator [Streptomyces ardesiacus]|uniref:NrdR family transcriptional regulator n=1 Tax=Streptomyces ardesiacus TaxID=285564 RepID=UPI003FD83E6A